MLLMRQEENKLSATYEPELYSVVSKRGDLVFIDRCETLLKRNVNRLSEKVHPTLTKGISATGARTNVATGAETTNGTSYPY